MRRLIFMGFAVVAVAAIGSGGAGSATVRAASSSQHWSALQSSADKNFVCEPAVGTPTNNDSVQTCEIHADNGTCIEKSDSPDVVQTCIFVQTSGDSTKRATAIQAAATDKGGSEQTHTQIINVTQSSEAASNFLDATQTVKQSLGPGHYDDTDEDEPESVTTASLTGITTSQEFHQAVTANQTTDSGDNNSNISQFGKQRARAKQTSPIEQSQNTLPGGQCSAVGDGTANQCSLVTQMSNTGQNSSTLDDTYLQFERAHKAAAGFQLQGRLGAGGIDHEIHQQSAGHCEIRTTQTERQVMRDVQANVTQTQHGPVRKGAGSNQDCSSDSNWTGGQDSKQIATSRPKETDIGSLVFAANAIQSNLLEYFGVSSGSIHATQNVSEQNNASKDTEQNSCPGAGGTDQVCGATISCTGGTCAPGEVPANPCASGEPDPEHPGRCTGGD